MILDHQDAELRENQFTPLPELVRYRAFLVHLININVLVTIIKHEAEIEKDFDTHAKNGLIKAKVSGLCRKLIGFEEPFRETYFQWISYIRIIMLPSFALFFLLKFKFDSLGVTKA